LRKLRKTGALDQSGEVVVIPRLPRVTGADKPAGWRRWSAAEKVEHLLGMSLDRVHDYLAWPPDEIDPHRLAAQREVVRVVVLLSAKMGIEAHRERARTAALDELARRFDSARQPDATAPKT
jgi:hypothetical protein